MRASSFGTCAKALTAEKLGLKAIPTSDVLQAAFERGHAHEDECAAALRADGGWRITGEQMEVEFEGITGHLDGLIEDIEGGAERVWEAKAPNAWASYERAIRTGKDTPLTIKYKWQSAIYMHATGLEQMVSCVEDGRVKSFIIEVPPFTREEIRARVEMLNECSTLPDDCEEGCQDDWACPYRYLHAKQEVVENEAVDMLVADYDMAASLIKRAKGMQERAKAELEKLLVFDDRIETASSIVTKYEQAGARTWDEAAMRADGIDPDKYRVAGKVSQRVKITRKGVDSVNEQE